ncbi:hypothetical protein NQ317_011219 [Molorchus minor]|uniref:DDE Tnp4 domain-containing protein n=1 Tax=Molorchus minor TaxID=1323400 RepID=A0ABQ9JG51_9CUCU|nr:hypothetical protein NQ317_011219 [Molorchus minor]
MALTFLVRFDKGKSIERMVLSYAINSSTCMTLLFYAQGKYQTTIGEDFNLGLSQPVVSRIINKISDLIAVHLLTKICTFSNANLVIVNVNARYPGATHDSAIWNTSTIHRHLKRKYQEGRRNCYLLGDSVYPIQPWLMTPIHGALPNTPEASYNELNCRARNVAERRFWYGRHVLGVFRVLHYSHSTAGRIIYACAVLHNICRRYNIEDNDSDEEDDAQNNEDDDIFNSSIELPNFTKSRVEQLESIVDRWLFFFKYAEETTDEDLRKIAEKAPIIKLAYD